jgi:alkylhydroperoxidase family enzyme
MRLGVDEAGVTELVAVVEHSQCLVVVAGALLMDRLGDEPGLVAAVDPAGAPEPVRAVLDEIAATLPAGMAVPGLWRALARNAHHLESTWRKEQAVMTAGALTALDKRRVALAVAMNGRSRYMIEYESALLRDAGDDDEAVLEILGVVDHYNALNTLSDAMQIESDIRPPQAGARPTIAPAPMAATPAAATVAPLPPLPPESASSRSVFTAPKPRPAAPPAAPAAAASAPAAPRAAIGNTPAAPRSEPLPTADASPESYSEVEAAERRFRTSLAAEAANERAQRAKIKKGFFGCVGVLVFLFILLMLFF